MHKEISEIKKKSKERIRKRIRKKIRGTPGRPRIFVFKSNRYVYLQAVDDEKGAVLATASTLEKEVKDKSKNSKNKEACQHLGEIFAKRLKDVKVEEIVFDRGIYPYHGRIRTLAEAMRKEGLVF